MQCATVNFVCIFYTRIYGSWVFSKEVHVCVFIDVYCDFYLFSIFIFMRHCLYGDVVVLLDVDLRSMSSRNIN